MQNRKVSNVLAHMHLHITDAYTQTCTCICTHMHLYHYRQIDLSTLSLETSLLSFYSLFPLVIPNYHGSLKSFTLFQLKFIYTLLILISYNFLSSFSWKLRILSLIIIQTASLDSLYNSHCNSIIHFLNPRDV